MDEIVRAVVGRTSATVSAGRSVSAYSATRGRQRSCDSCRAARRARRPAPDFWTILTNPVDRGQTVAREGWKAVAQVFVLAAVIDVAYQVMVLRWVYPLELLLVSFLLAALPICWSEVPRTGLRGDGRQHVRTPRARP